MTTQTNELLSNVHDAMLNEVSAYGSRTLDLLAWEVNQQVCGVSDTAHAKDLVASVLLTDNDWNSEDVDGVDYWTFKDIN